MPDNSKPLILAEAYGQALMESALNNFVAFMDEVVAWAPGEDND